MRLLGLIEHGAVWQAPGVAHLDRAVGAGLVAAARAQLGQQDAVFQLADPGLGLFFIEKALFVFQRDLCLRLGRLFADLCVVLGKDLFDAFAFQRQRLA